MSGFVDEAQLHAKGGNGGAGAVSFRREAHVAHGGPAGGMGSHDLGGQGLLGDVLDRLVDGHLDPRPRRGRGRLIGGRERHPARRGHRIGGPRLAGQDRLVLVLHARDAVAVPSDRAHERFGQESHRHHPLGLGDEVDPVDGLGRDGGRHRVGNPVGQVDESGGFGELGTQRVARDAQEGRQGRGHRSRIRDEVGIGHHRLAGHCFGEDLAVSVVDAAAHRWDGDGLGQLGP